MEYGGDDDKLAACCSDSYSRNVNQTLAEELMALQNEPDPEPGTACSAGVPVAGGEYDDNIESGMDMDEDPMVARLRGIYGKNGCCKRALYVVFTLPEAKLFLLNGVSLYKAETDAFITSRFNANQALIGRESANRRIEYPKAITKFSAYSSTGAIVYRPVFYGALEISNKARRLLFTLTKAITMDSDNIISFTKRRGGRRIEGKKSPSSAKREVDYSSFLADSYALSDLGCANHSSRHGVLMELAAKFISNYCYKLYMEDDLKRRKNRVGLSATA